MEYDLVKSTEFGEALHVEIKWRESPLTNLGLIQEKFLLETLRLFWNEKGVRAERSPAIDSDSVSADAPVSD